MIAIRYVTTLPPPPCKGRWLRRAASSAHLLLLRWQISASWKRVCVHAHMHPCTPNATRTNSFTTSSSHFHHLLFGSALVYTRAHAPLHTNAAHTNSFTTSSSHFPKMSHHLLFGSAFVYTRAHAHLYSGNTTTKVAESALYLEEARLCTHMYVRTCTRLCTPNWFRHFIIFIFIYHIFEARFLSRDFVFFPVSSKSEMSLHQNVSPHQKKELEKPNALFISLPRREKSAWKLGNPS